MLKFFLRRLKTPPELSAELLDTPHNEHRDPYLERILDEIRLNENNARAIIKEQLKTKEIK
jgi:hypothetical protein